MDTPSEHAARNLAAVREQRPLVHSITNLVSISAVANALLAAGGSAVMALAPEEAGEIAGQADALVLNVGTPTAERLDAMQRAGRQAFEHGIPIAVDPVGAGASSMRTGAVKGFLAQWPIKALRGNPSEILALSSGGVQTAGVDAAHAPELAQTAAAELAAKHRTVVAVTGPSDRVTDGQRTAVIANGHPLLTKITGTGCIATAMIAMFLCVEPDPLRAAADALAFFGLAGEIAGRQAEAPGSFWMRLLDALYTMTPAQLADGCRITLA